MTHIAKRRLVFAQPLPAPVPLHRDCLDAWLERHQQVLAMVRDAPRVAIGLAYAGESFSDARVADLQARLADLKALGYRYPEAVDDALAGELIEELHKQAEGVAHAA